MPFNSLLSEKKVHLTSAQQRALEYIIDNYEEAIFLTASRVAQRAGVSEATIVRLAQRLGFDGYPAMQRMLREDFQSRLSTVTRLEQTVKNVRDEEDILVKVMQEDLRNLTQTLRSLPIETFRRAVADMGKAQRIFVAGLKGSHGPALVLARYLRFLKEETYLLEPGYGALWDILYGIGPNDLVIGISFPRYTKLTVEILEYAHNHGAQVGAITDSILSPLATYADWVLPVHCKLDSFIESFTAAMSLVNALLTAVSIQNPRETLQSLKGREMLWKEKDIYITPRGTRNKR
jgi:DNA-binding MurR/RpiR family transcriptional regulator